LVSLLFHIMFRLFFKLWTSYIEHISVHFRIFFLEKNYNLVVVIKKKIVAFYYIKHFLQATQFEISNLYLIPNIEN